MGTCLDIFRSEKCPRGHQVRRDEKLPNFWDGTGLAGQTLDGMLREGKKKNNGQLSRTRVSG